MRLDPGATNSYAQVRQHRHPRSLPGIVLEIAFDSVHRSSRHRSGVAMRFPRINRIRWDKPYREADMLETVEKLLT